MKSKLGLMRHRLVVRALVRADDGGGGTDRVDTNTAIIWGRVDRINALEKSAYASLGQSATHTILIRWSADVREGVTLVQLVPGQPEPSMGTADMPAGTQLYVLTSIDANPSRPGEFMQIAAEQRAII